MEFVHFHRTHFFHCCVSLPKCQMCCEKHVRCLQWSSCNHHPQVITSHQSAIRSYRSSNLASWCTLPKANSSPLKSYRLDPKGKAIVFRIAIHFAGVNSLLVSGRVTIISSTFIMTKKWSTPNICKSIWLPLSSSTPPIIIEHRGSPRQKLTFAKVPVERPVVRRSFSPLNCFEPKKKFMTTTNV